MKAPHRDIGGRPAAGGDGRWSWQETRPVGFQRTHFGVSVFDGAYRYNDTRVTPSWGGSMFEALMPTLLVPEEVWGGGSWRANHPLWVQAQISHGLREAGYGYWGFSPDTGVVSDSYLSLDQGIIMAAIGNALGGDVLSGGPGDDTLAGGPGSDHHEGGTGDNRCPDLTAADTANAC